LKYQGLAHALAIKAQIPGRRPRTAQQVVSHTIDRHGMTTVTVRNPPDMGHVTGCKEWWSNLLMWQTA
jgi:hypothetical protein